MRLPFRLASDAYSFQFVVNNAFGDSETHAHGHGQTQAIAAPSLASSGPCALLDLTGLRKLFDTFKRGGGHLFITSAKEVMFSPVSVCLFVWDYSKTTDQSV